MEPEKKIPTPLNNVPGIGGGNKIVQTYAEDMAEAIEGGNQGLIKKIIHGEEKHEAERQELSPESKKNKTFMFASILLIVLAVGTLSYFLIFKQDKNTVSVAQQFTPLIFNDKSTFIEVFGFNKDEVGQIVFNQVSSTEVKNGGVEGIYLTENKQIVGLRRFLSLIGANFAPNSSPLLVQENFLMGVVNNPENSGATAGTGFFILIKVRSLADIFDSLRAWETKMLPDLHKFLGVEITKDTNYLFTKNFDDGIVENKNARIIYDKDGKIVLMYILADDNSVLITNSQIAAHEILLRLSGSQKKQ